MNMPNEDFYIKEMDRAQFTICAEIEVRNGKQTAWIHSKGHVLMNIDFDSYDIINLATSVYFRINDLITSLHLDKLDVLIDKIKKYCIFKEIAEIHYAMELKKLQQYVKKFKDE